MFDLDNWQHFGHYRASGVGHLYSFPGNLSVFAADAPIENESKRLDLEILIEARLRRHP
jgi:hypothetical protein